MYLNFVIEKVSDIAIGIESGIFSINLDTETTTLDIAIIIVITKSGKQIVTSTPGFVFPEIYVKTARDLGFEKNTVGQIIAEKLGGDKTDPPFNFKQRRNYQTGNIDRSPHDCLKTNLKNAPQGVLFCWQQVKRF